MQNINWPGIMKIKEIQHKDSKGNIIWEAFDIPNLLHLEGEQFLLQAAFTGGKTSTIIPEYYYLGLDNRLLVSVEDNVGDLLSEPSFAGYQRAEIASSNDFAINFEQNHYVATSPIVAFRATTGSWGPVSNLFLTAQVNGSYKLLSTAVLPAAVALDSGESVTMRIGMQIREYVA
jgi:hypothetical protein